MPMGAPAALGLRVDASTPYATPEAGYSNLRENPASAATGWIVKYLRFSRSPASAAEGIRLTCVARQLAGSGASTMSRLHPRKQT